MRRSLVLVLLCGAACAPSVSLPPAPYSCDPSSAAADQCPGAWRCGLAGSCFDPGVGAALACAKDLQCPDGWRCGQAGSCFAADAGAPLPCGSDSQCAIGWRCGAVSRQCQQIGDAGPYPCAKDDDCEDVPDWRCDTLHAVCAEVGADALDPTGYSGPVVASRVSPLAPAGSASAAAFGFFQGCLACAATPLFSFVEDAGLEQLAFLGTLNGLDYDVLTGWPEPIRAISIADDGSGATFVLDSRGLWSVPVFSDAGSTPVALGLPADEDRLRLMGTSQGFVLAFGPNDYSYSNGSSSALGLTIPASTGSQTISDIAIASGPVGGEWAIAVASDGLMAAQLTQENGSLAFQPGSPLRWLPIAGRQYANHQCGNAAINPVPERVEDLPPLPMQGSNDTLSVETDQGWQWLVSSYETVTDPGPGADAGLFLPQGPYCAVSGLVSPVPLGDSTDGTEGLPLPLCPPGMNPLHFGRAVNLGGLTGLATVCLADGGPSQVRVENQGTETQFRSGSTVSFDVAGGLDDQGGLSVLVGGHHQLWSLPSDGSAFLSVALDQAAGSFGASADGGLLASGGDSLWYAGAIGLQPTDVAGLVQGPFVEGNPDLSLRLEGTAPNFFALHLWSTSLNQEIAYVYEPTLTLQPPFNAVWYPVPGTSEQGYVVITANTLVLGGLVASNGSGDPLLTVKATIPVQVPVTSLVVAPASSALFDAYLQTSVGVYLLEATNLKVWHLSLLDTMDGNTVNVWTDHSRPRLGYEDGTVYGLPVPVQLAAPLPFSSCAGETALQYASLCGQSYLLTTCGLYRLAADGGSIGTWTPELAPFDAGFDFGNLAGGSLNELPGHLYVSSAYGEVVSVAPTRACAP